MIKTVLDEKVDILNYLPQFMQNFKEISEIMKTENIELELIYRYLKKELFNQFVHSCDIQGIAKFEKLLGINVDETLELETRKFNVITKWGGELPYTYRNLLKKLDYLCGKDSYTLEIKNKDYTVNIITSFIDENRKNILINSLRNIIPANMTITNDNIIKIIFNQEVFVSSAIAEYRNYTIGE